MGKVVFDLTISIEAIFPLLDDPEAQVREETLTVLPQLDATASPTLISQITDLVTKDPSLGVQSKAIIALAKLGCVDESISQLTAWLKSKESLLVISALEAVSEIGAYLNSSFDVQLIIRYLEGLSATIRRAAISALR